MNEMIERVARVLCLSNLDLHAKTPGVHASLVDEEWPEFKLAAIAVIGAMREPTSTMTAKGFEAIFGSGCDKLAADCWRGMVDEALR